MKNIYKLFLNFILFFSVFIHATFFFLAYATPPNTKTTQQAAIASAHPLATQAGIDILKKGGNAFDAAVAVASTLAVVEPYGSGIGGGGFWLLHDTSKNKTVMVDGREKAPGAAHETMYQDKNGQVLREASLNGPLAAAIPGEVAAMVHISKNYGKLPLSDSLASAIHYAEKGFPVNKAYLKAFNRNKIRLLQSADSQAIFMNNKTELSEGELIIQKDLAKTLKSVAKHGRDGFYKGSVANKLIKGVRNAGGIWTLEDLANYNIIEREPITIKYQGATITSAPPPSSGGIALAEIFNMLSEMDFDELPAKEKPHHLIEAMRRAYFDRAQYLGDSDFVKVPTQRLLSTDYAKQLIQSINQKATPSHALGTPSSEGTSGTHTTHFSIIDQYGNKVATTLSINLYFGSGFTVPGTGVLLNDEMDDFSAKPGEPNAYGLIGNEANAITPNKRPLSSMSPTFVETDTHTAILGTPGGSRIITMVLLGTLDMLAGKPVSEWVNTPRYHHQYLPDVIQVEPALENSSWADNLEERGHTIKSVKRKYGNMQAILLNKNNKKLTAASDLRGIGQATVIDLTAKK